MKRELKFRAWDSGDKLIKDEFLMCYSNKGIMTVSGISIDSSSDDSDEDVCIEQFTGLTDKNGKEIYEGDIVNHQIDFLNTGTPTYNKNEVVKFNKGSFSLDGSVVSLFPALGHSVEVIGNIHENKELL